MWENLISTHIFSGCTGWVRAYLISFFFLVFWLLIAKGIFLLLSFPLKLKHFFSSPKKSWKRSSIFLHFLLNFIASCHRCRWPFLILIVFFLNAKIPPPASEIVPMGGNVWQHFSLLKFVSFWKCEEEEEEETTPQWVFSKRKKGACVVTTGRTYIPFDVVSRFFKRSRHFSHDFLLHPIVKMGGNYYIRDTLSSSSFVTPKMWNKSVFFFFFPPFAQSFKKEKKKKDDG